MAPERAAETQEPVTADRQESVGKQVPADRWASGATADLQPVQNMWSAATERIRMWPCTVQQRSTALDNRAWPFEVLDRPAYSTPLLRVHSDTGSGNSFWAHTA